MQGGSALPCGWHHVGDANEAATPATEQRALQLSSGIVYPLRLCPEHARKFDATFRGSFEASSEPPPAP